jgi:putative Mg2+ transporter-C (MgtC) family protein
MTLLLEDVIKLLIALVIGGLIGLEREFRDKAAGFRTMMLICVGATLFTIFSLRLGADSEPVRIAANIVTGVGFIGAGAILRGGGRVVGLTTASTIWLAAALGMGIGGGEYLFSAIVAALVLLILWAFPRIGAWIAGALVTRIYQITCLASHEKRAQLVATFRECGLRVRSHKQVKRGDEMTCTWEAVGPLEKHERLVEILFADPEVRELLF